MNKPGIAAIGECMLELSGRSGGQWRMGFAGDTFNTLWALRALTLADTPADYISAFGDDPFSQDQLSFFDDNGIGIAASPRIAGARPGLYAITLTGAERAFTYWRSDSAARRLADEPGRLEKSFANRSLIYFSGITLAILEKPSRKVLMRAIDTARQAGSLVAFDPNYRPHLWPDETEARRANADALAVADIALPTFADEQALYGDLTVHDTVARLREAGIGEIVVKNGADSALSASKDTIEHIPAANVEAIDTTGAGDAFNGAYLAARLAGDIPTAAVKRAHRVAAAAIQTRGALTPFETMKSAFVATS